MGYGCTRPSDRALVSKGIFETDSIFTDNKDIPFGGVLFAIPALLENGLLKYLNQYYQLDRGYYTIDHIFLTLAFLPLLRLKSLENLRNVSPGELGKLIGLDRVPEVKTLRKKLSELSSQEQAKLWSAALSKDWMEADPESCGALYIDGHVRVYNGKQAKLPVKYISRQKLCLRGMSDYWVNDFLGRPFFVVRKAVNSGLITVLRDEIVPDLIERVPNQPTQEELSERPYLSRFMLVFDREGFSPDFIKEMWELRIACCTYRKHVKDIWALEEFKVAKVTLSNKETTEMKLAERGTYLGGKIWVREIRKLTESGHQTSIISTEFQSETGKLAVAMFSRWCQENFFKYMMEHYGIDRLIEYETEDVKGTESVVNPEYRNLDYQIKSISGKLKIKQANFMTIEITDTISEARRVKVDNKKAELLEDIESIKIELVKLKQKRKQTPKHVLFSQLSENQKFKSLASEKKLLVDTVKMICYRAETCLTSIVREGIAHKDEARNLVRVILKSDIDIEVDKENNVLKVSLHNLSSRSMDQVVQNLCDELNRTETYFPGTKLRLFYKLVTSKYP